MAKKEKVPCKARIPRYSHYPRCCGKSASAGLLGQFCKTHAKSLHEQEQFDDLLHEQRHSLRRIRETERNVRNGVYHHERELEKAQKRLEEAKERLAEVEERVKSAQEAYDSAVQELKMKIELAVYERSEEQ